MSNEPKNAQPTGNEVEYAFESVPASARKKLGSILVILTGYTISLSNFVTGATVGSQMDFKSAVLSCAVGNLILILVATVLGIIGAETGLTTSVLAHKSLGKRSSAIMSILLAVSAVNWIAVNANTFADLVINNFSWWPFGMGITAIITVVLWAQSAIRGSKGLEFVSWLGVPCAILLTIACAIAIGARAGYQSVFSYAPSGTQISFAAGSTSFCGAWIFGCIVTPDVTRYAKNGKHVAIGAPIAVTIGLFALEVIGIMTAQATNTAGFVAATAALGLGILVFICSIFCVWTTQDNNIYSASLALQNVFQGTKLEGKVKHSWLAWTVAIAAGIFAACGAVNYLLPVVKTLSVLLPPLPAIMIAEHYVIKKSKENLTINWLGLISWAIGTAIGQVANNHNFLVPAAVSMVVSFVVYIIVSKAFDAKVNKV